MSTVFMKGYQIKVVMVQAALEVIEKTVPTTLVACNAKIHTCNIR